MTNPFSISFGKEPSLLIARPVQMETILDNFTSVSAPTQAFMIMGVRGSGKTVTMTEISRRLSHEKHWIVIDLNPEEDILKQLAGKLCSIPELNLLFTKAEINLSLFNLGISIKNVPPISDLDTAIEKMLDVLQKREFRILLTIDEVTNTPFVKTFAHAFQGYIRQNFPVFLLMTGLYENISKLQNDKSLTFLYRTPKVYMQPLNLSAVADNYMNTFQIDEEEALHMAKLTNGYPFAFQVLGYLKWNHKSETLEQILPEYDQYLQDYVYEKIWAECSEKDRRILTQIAFGYEQNKDIRKKLGMSSSLMSIYRKRLIDKGIVDGSEHGKLKFTLPRFDKFVKLYASL